MQSGSIAPSHELSHCLEQFEQAWHQGTPPDLRAALERAGANAASLRELVAIDLEMRWRKASEPKGLAADASGLPAQPRLEDYARALPELGGLDQLSAELIVAEYRVRWRWGDRPSREEYAVRFPSRAAELAGSFDEVDREQLAEEVSQFAASLASTTDGEAGSLERTHSLLPRRPAASAGDAAWPQLPGYEITVEIAKGGMGRVYAGRELALDREVAIKTLLPGADAERFVTESRITARLPHPGIPPVYALGTLASGAPFLAMKLIRGRTLSAILRERATPQADLPRFIQIFEQIAQAVGFAHAQGIIHRDLKPLNVMVGAFGEVQVMDWGLAKELTSSESERPAASCTDDPSHTGSGAILGTPGYMSPEQARGESVDARADVFALGSILTTILTGQPAFWAATRAAMIDLAAAGDLAATYERLAAIGADADLVALAKRCLSAAAQDRPADAHDVAIEIAAYRASVEARLKKAETEQAEAIVRETEEVKRRHTIQWAAGIVAVVLLLGIIGTSVGMYLANESAGKEKTANALTARRLAQIETINDSVFDIFEGFDIRKVKEGFDPVESILADRLIAAGRKLDAKAIEDPLILARIQNRLGETLLGLGRADPALEFLRSTLDLRRTHLGPNHADTLDSLGNLGVAYHNSGKLDLALPLLEEARKLREERFGPDHEHTLQSMSNLAFAYQDSGMLDLAVPLYEEAVRRCKKKLGPNDPTTILSMNNLAAAYSYAGRLGLALPLLEETLQTSKTVFGIDHPNTLTCMGNVALCYKDAGKADLALPLLEETLRLSRAKNGAGHPNTLMVMNNLAGAHEEAGRLEMAMELYEEALGLSRTNLGSDHPNTLTVMVNLALLYEAAGKPDLALRMFDETLKLRQVKLGADHADTLWCMNKLAEHHRDTQKFDLALPLYEELLRIRRTKFGPDHPGTLKSLSDLADAYYGRGKLDLAVPLYEEAFKRSKATLGEDDANTLNRMCDLAECYRATNNLTLALPLCEEALRLSKAKLGPEHPKTLTTMNCLAACYFGIDKADLALPLFEEVFRIQKTQPGLDYGETLVSMNNLAECYVAVGKVDLAIPLHEQTLKLRQVKLGRDDTETLMSMANLARAYQKAGKLDTAQQLCDEALPLAKAKLRPSDQIMLQIVFHLAATYCRAARNEKAVSIMREYIEAERQRFPPEHSDFASKLASTARELLQGQLYIAAEEICRECLAIREKKDRDLWSTYNTQVMVGRAILGQKKYAEAEPLLLQGYAGMKEREASIPASAKPRLTEAIDALIELYTALEKPEEVQKWRVEKERPMQPPQLPPAPK